MKNFYIQDYIWCKIIIFALFMFITIEYKAKKTQLKDWAINTLLFFYFVSLIALTLFPLELGYGGSEETLLRLDLHFMSSREDYSEFYNNILLFIPLGFLMVFKCKKYIWSFLFSVVISLGVELAQALVGIIIRYPYRATTLDDFITNSIGGSIGFLLAIIVSLIIKRTCKVIKRKDMLLIPNTLLIISNVLVFLIYLNIWDILKRL